MDETKGGELFEILDKAQESKERIIECNKRLEELEREKDLINGEIKTHHEILNSATVSLHDKIVEAYQLIPRKPD